MQRVLLVLCSIFVPVLDYEAENIEKFNRFHAAYLKCQESPETSIDEDFLCDVVINQEVPAEVPESAPNFLLCLAKLLQLQDEDGNLNSALIRERIEHHQKDPNRVAKLMDTCIVQKDTPQYTTIFMIDCLSREAAKVGLTNVDAMLEVL
ncbi:uncharacterized protein LOC132699273 [Cylas formicarius]|uniref:Odorant binding protein n=1 Tax=Cylas formicarius TaxID=197179 RepID=A0A6B7M933_CYLFO|nr:uncharacterized protein LOC132699273 [Cylas formicarius]QFO46778.1 odorant binding protein [Cylas formicarius]